MKDELTRLIDRDVTQPPFFKKDHEFFLRTLTGESQPKLYTRITGRDILLFDPTKLDPSGKVLWTTYLGGNRGDRLLCRTRESMRVVEGRTENERDHDDD